MSDLVKRLREDAEMWDAILGPGASITREAADAIEELTAALRDVTGLAEMRPGHLGDYKAAIADARVLLTMYGASNG